MGDPVIRPVTEGHCVFVTGLDPAGRPRCCLYKATMTIDGKALCDQHAEIAMTSACGRNVKIARTGCTE